MQNKSPPSPAVLQLGITSVMDPRRKRESGAVVYAMGARLLELIWRTYEEDFKGGCGGGYWEGCIVFVIVVAGVSCEGWENGRCRFGVRGLLGERGGVAW